MSKPPGGGEGRQADTLMKSSVSRGTANAVSAVCVCVCVCTPAQLVQFKEQQRC